MENNDNFLSELQNLIKEKSQWYDAVEIPRLAQFYRTEHQELLKLIDCLVKRGFMNDDPYKNNKNVTAISSFDDSPILSTDIANAIGIRFSDFENVLGYICNSFKFSVASLDAATIAQLASANAFFIWSELGNSQTNNTTKAFGALLAQIRRSGDAICVALVNDIVSSLEKNVAEINRILSALLDFRHEVAKLEIRKALADQPLYSQSEIGASASVEFEKIRSFFMTKKIALPFTIQNVQEIVIENVASDALERRHALFQKLAVPSNKPAKKKRATPREAVLNAVSLLGELSSPFLTIHQKISENAKVLKSQDANFFSNFVSLLRKFFGIVEEPEEYRVRVVSRGSATSHLESIVVDEFLAELQKRANFYAGLSEENSKDYMFLTRCDDKKLCDFMRRQISGCRKLVVLLNALDMFFKENIRTSLRMNIRGFKIEIVTVSNLVYKITNLYQDAIALL